MLGQALIRIPYLSSNLGRKQLILKVPKFLGNRFLLSVKKHSKIV